MIFCFVQKFFFGQHKSWNIYFFCRAKCEFFFQNLTLGCMTKILNQIIFFSSTKIRIFFSATLGIRIFFQKKTITPCFKLNGRSLTRKIMNHKFLVVNVKSSLQKFSGRHHDLVNSYTGNHGYLYVLYIIVTILSLFSLIYDLSPDI